jgi:hypothetical protein
VAPRPDKLNVIIAIATPRQIVGDPEASEAAGIDAASVVFECGLPLALDGTR